MPWKRGKVALEPLTGQGFPACSGAFVTLQLGDLLIYLSGPTSNLHPLLIWPTWPRRAGIPTRFVAPSPSSLIAPRSAVRDNASPPPLASPPRSHRSPTHTNLRASRTNIPHRPAPRRPHPSPIPPPIPKSFPCDTTSPPLPAPAHLPPPP